MGFPVGLIRKMIRNQEVTCSIRRAEPYVDVREWDRWIKQHKVHALPGVHDCAVFGIPDPEFGEALMAMVEPQPGVTLDVPGLRTQLKARLADYKVPKHIEIQRDLPREDSGKIFKRRLRDPYWERAGRRI